MGIPAYNGDGTVSPARTITEVKYLKTYSDYQLEELRKKFDEALNKIEKRIIERYKPMRKFKSTDFEVQIWAEGRQDLYVIYAEVGYVNGYFLWKDGTVHLNSTGYAEAEEVFEDSLGYYANKEEAELFLLAYKGDNGEGMSVEELSKLFGYDILAGIPCDEDEDDVTSVSIGTEHDGPEPKYVPQVGDVATLGNIESQKRLIVQADGVKAFDFYGNLCNQWNNGSEPQVSYEYFGKIKDLDLI